MNDATKTHNQKEKSLFTNLMLHIEYWNWQQFPLCSLRKHIFISNCEQTFVRVTLFTCRIINRALYIVFLFCILFHFVEYMLYTKFSHNFQLTSNLFVAITAKSSDHIEIKFNIQLDKGSERTCGQPSLFDNKYIDRFLPQKQSYHQKKRLHKSPSEYCMSTYFLNYVYLLPLANFIHLARQCSTADCADFLISQFE